MEIVGWRVVDEERSMEIERWTERDGWIEVNGERLMERVDMDEEKYIKRFGESLMERDRWKGLDGERVIKRVV
jgi:hypothetical protein